ncbi:MAG TPA: class I SAM-dependent methyltransferase [Candidatus Omnitrophota bacterium]|nr:class I SAM-dependent methyltransferase [Candidatus Omnitrophota bacterium]
MTVTQAQQCPLCQNDEISLYAVVKPSGGVKKDYYHCPRCFLIFVPSPFHLDPAREKERYDLHENSPDDEAYVKFLSKLTGPLLWRLKPGWEGLDFGCGPGPTVSAILKKEGLRVFDYDPFYFPEKKLLERQYDFITCTEVLEHLRFPRESFILWERLLRAGGTIAVMTEVWQEKEPFSNWWYLKEPTHICFFRQQTFLWVAKWLDWHCEFPHLNVVVFTKK